MTKKLESISGVAISDFTDEVWSGVAEAYVRSAQLLPDDQEVTPDYWYHMTANRVISGHGEFRLGSVITMHSKLWVERCIPNTIHFDFSANADKNELARAEKYAGVTEASINADMQARITAFLGGLGVARTITNCWHVR